MKIAKKSSPRISWFVGAAWTAWLAGVAVGLAILGAVVGAVWDKGIVGAIFGAAVGALGAAIVPAIKSWRDQVENRRSVVRRSSAGAPTNSRLELVKSVVPAKFGARRSLVNIEYQSRSVEAEVRRLLASGEPVLVLGASMAGKSRMAAEVLRTEYPNHALLRPIPEALPGLFEEGLPRDCVFFVDDLETVLTTVGLRPDWVDILLDHDNIVLATMRSSARQVFERVRGGERHPQEAALNRFAVVRLRDEPNEMNAIASRMPDAATAAGVERYGLGTYLGGGYLAAQRLDDIEATNPLRYAVVHAAADLRRIGLMHATRTQLEGLAIAYLPARRLDQESFSEAVAWATQVVHEVVQLLEPSTHDRLRASDYIVDHISARFPEPAESIWEVVPRMATTLGECLLVGGLAHEFGKSDVANELWARYNYSYSTQNSPALGFALIELARGRLESARYALHVLVESRDPDQAPKAALALGELEMTAGDREAARTALEIAIASNRNDVAPKAARNLAQLEMSVGNVSAARDALRLAIESGHAKSAPRALYELGVLEEGEKNVEAARAAFEGAVRSGEKRTVPPASLRLAGLLLSTKNDSDARSAYQVVMAANDATLLPAAAFHLAELEIRVKSIPAARTAYRIAMESQHQDYSPAAGFRLGLLELQENDASAARSAFQRVVTSEHHLHAPAAAFRLGLLEIAEKNADAARTALQVAINSGDPQYAPLAAVGLGLLEVRARSTGAAREAFQIAIDSKHGEAWPIAAVDLGRIELDAGDHVAARAALRGAIESGHPDCSPEAAYYLGLIEADAGNLGVAKTVLQAAVASEHVEWAPRALDVLTSLETLDEPPPP